MTYLKPSKLSTQTPSPSTHPTMTTRNPSKPLPPASRLCCHHPDIPLNNTKHSNPNSASGPRKSHILSLRQIRNQLRGRRRHQRCIGKLGLTQQRLEMKWSLKVKLFFGCIGAVHMRRYELLVDGVGSQVVCDIAQTLVVHDVHFGRQSSRFEVEVKCGGCFEFFGRALFFKGAARMVFDLQL